MAPRFKQFLPVLEWAEGYTAADFRSDLIAGTVVVFITVPQVIAYAFLAGLPAEVGLYAALAALLGYAFLGSSRSLAVGPTAIIAMMTLEAVSAMAEPGSAAYLSAAIKLSLVTGLLLIVLRILNFGAVISFLSHAVVTGFISAAACLIITNQIPTLLGLGASQGTAVAEVMTHIAGTFDQTNSFTLGLSLTAMLLLLLCRTSFDSLLKALGLGEQTRGAIVKSAPMYAVIAGTLTVSILSWDTTRAVAVVGEIPAALPELKWVAISWIEASDLLPSALLMAMVIFMESTSIGTAVASRRRQKIDANQELAGLGVANIGSAFVGGFPVAGSFARTVVNFSSGAVTPVASLITALFLLVTLMALAPLFYYLPKGILAAIIVMSAVQLIDPTAIRKIFQFNTTDAVTFSITFLAVLITGVESGILIGIVISFVLLIRSSSKPHIAIVGRVGDAEHFRNVERYDTRVSPRLLAIRIDESFYFVNSRYIESFVLNALAEQPQLEHVLLICTGVHFIDTSGLEMLEELSRRLEENDILLHLAEVKGPVMDHLKKSDLIDEMRGKVFFTTDHAFKQLVGI